MRKAWLQLHFAVILAGFTGVLGKLISLHEGWLVWYRLWMAAVLLAMLLLFTRRFEIIKGKGLARLLGVGAVIGFHWLTFYASIKYANTSVALVCFAATGFFTALVDPLLNRKKLSWPELFLGIFSLIGIYIIFDFNPHFQKGIIFGIISSIGSAVFPVLNKKLVEEFSPRTISFYELSGAFVSLSLLLPLYLHYFPASHYIPTGSDWVWLAVLAFFCTVLAFELQLNALTRISAFTSNLTYTLEPVYGVTLAFLILNEGKFLGPSFYAGLSFVAMAVVIQMWRVKKVKVIK